MIVLLLVGFLGGLVTGISPCILPVLPVIFVSGAASGLDDVPDELPHAQTAYTPDPVYTTDPAYTTAPGSISDPGYPPVPVEPVAVTVGTPYGAVGGSPVGDDAAAVGVTLPSGPTPSDEAQLRLIAARRRRRPFAVVFGLVLSFSVFTLLGIWILGALGLPDDLLRWVGIVLLGVLGLGLVIPVVGELLERPFAHLTAGREVSEGGGFMLGLSLGLVFVPCAGPVLTTISVVGDKNHIGFSALLLTAAFAVGVSIPLLLFALAGQLLASHMQAVRTHAATTRRVIGAVLMVTALVLALNLTNGIQKAVPGYTNDLTNSLEANSSALRALDGVKGESDGGSLSNCTSGSPVLQECGRAPNFAGITKWLNTPGGRPLTIASLKGRVVLVDFWTYSCINCQRSLPHVEAWNAAYSRDGLTVVGVHTPEFAFEHVVSNVIASAAQLGVHYPVAIDNNYDTFDAYQNNYWPAEYLIDASGNVRHVDDSEGDYSQTETFIRQLLVAAHPTVSLPPRTDVPDRTPQYITTPESYLGYQYSDEYLAGESVQADTMTDYSPPTDLPQNTFAFGGQWDVGPEGVVAGSGATIALRFQAEDVYLVLGGTGTVKVDLNGRPTRTVVVGGVPTLHTLVGPGPYQEGLLTLSASPGVTAYDFTFG